MRSMLSPSQVRAKYPGEHNNQKPQCDKGTAILVVSFGTSYPEALTSGIAHVEQAIANALSVIPVFRAFTSNMVIDKLKKRDGVVIDKPNEAIKNLIEMGYSRIVVQPLHMIPGFEFDKLRRSVVTAAHNREIHLQLGRPLLHDHEDFLKLIDALSKYLPQAEPGVGILWMGHGTAHPANSAYVLLERLWRETRKDLYIANVDGYPELDQVIDTLEQQFQRIILMPLMLVAGDHAINDMASDEDDSYKSQLEARGMAVSCILKGLGAYPEIAEIFSDRVKEMVSHNL